MSLGLRKKKNPLLGAEERPWFMQDQDPDRDGLTTGEELLLGTNPFAWDTDGDYWSDYAEARLGFGNADPRKKRNPF